MEYIIFSTHLFEVKETLSLAWSAAHSRYSFYQEALDFLELDNYDDFKKALREGLNDAPPINLLFITRDGHIGLQNIGSYPIMNNQAEEAGYVKDGTSSKHAWTGMLRGRDRMFIEDPEKGYIVTANNRLTTSNFRGGRY
jgi:penicillin amidase